MVGPMGCFFRAEDHALTLEPARALVALHAAGIALVLVSGRTRAQLVEAGRIFGADGFVGELGAVLGWDGGRSAEILTGDMPPSMAAAPAAAIEETGVVVRLFERYPGRLEYHAPWHLGHEADVMLRGNVDAADAARWLADEGFGWLVLSDNGVLPMTRPTGLDPAALPAHVYHLMPAGLSKGLGVARDLARRGLSSEQAVAIGDSASDLEMAPFVGRLWVTANGARQPHMPALMAALDNVVTADEAVGPGWAQAVRAAIAGARA
ncbi:MAG: HAD hydrolase family protein [Actinomycetota bacterium]|nr:HAD hydrolase family protein [Actinomycetota bacterium]